MQAVRKEILHSSLFILHFLKYCENNHCRCRRSRHTFGQTIVAREARHHINRRQRGTDEHAQFQLHLKTVNASPTSIKGLKEVGAGEADLFIAVTPDESRNITACMLATNLGAVKTVGRIDNYEYLLPKNKEFFQKLGVDSLIYPEMLAAKEIVSSIRMSWVRQWWEFCGGALILIGTKIREKAEILTSLSTNWADRSCPITW